MRIERVRAYSFFLALFLPSFILVGSTSGYAARSPKTGGASVGFQWAEVPRAELFRCDRLQTSNSLSRVQGLAVSKVVLEQDREEIKFEGNFYRRAEIHFDLATLRKLTEAAAEVGAKGIPSDLKSWSQSPDVLALRTRVQQFLDSTSGETAGLSEEEFEKLPEALKKDPIYTKGLHPILLHLVLDELWARMNQIHAALKTNRAFILKLPGALTSSKKAELTRNLAQLIQVSMPWMVNVEQLLGAFGTDLTWDSLPYANLHYWNMGQALRNLSENGVYNLIYLAFTFDQISKHRGLKEPLKADIPDLLSLSGLAFRLVYLRSLLRIDLTNTPVSHPMSCAVFPREIEPCFR